MMGAFFIFLKVSKLILTLTIKHDILIVSKLIMILMKGAII